LINIVAAQMNHYVPQSVPKPIALNVRRRILHPAASDRSWSYGRAGEPRRSRCAIGSAEAARAGANFAVMYCSGIVVVDRQRRSYCHD
jgi:hypothetical protein